MKTTFIQILMFLACVSFAHAQDVMVKRNGTEIEGKVIEVGIDKVTYKRLNDLNGANFVIRKSELTQIEFENGQVVLMNDRGGPRSKNSPVTNMDEAFGRNMVNFSPFKALDSGPGIAASYEVVVGKRGNFGIILPVSVIFPEAYNIFYDSGSTNTSMLYLSPGFKIYPFGQRKVTYSVGPNIYTGFGKTSRYENYYDPTTGQYVSSSVRAQNFRFGILVNNYVNFQITQNFQIGLNAGLGSRYIDRVTRNGVISNSNIQVTGEFNFNLGFRF